MSLKRKLSDRSDATSGPQEVFRSDPIEDRSSTFVAYYSPSLKPKELLSRLPEIETADHKIVGYRRESNQQSITKATQYVTGSDDDGEKFAGKRVENVLSALQVVGSVVVARYYGGVLLGPVRFTHIETCARDAVRNWQASLKRRKLEADEALEQQRLSRLLADRDQSIDVLRKLHLQKERDCRAAQGQADGETPTSSSQSGVDYTSMPVERLRKLETARDATIAFLLRRIDEADSVLATLKNQTTEREHSETS
jgi:putative IMPACT (imprinted ancient) family translation regulator